MRLRKPTPMPGCRSQYVSLSIPGARVGSAVCLKPRFEEVFCVLTAPGVWGRVIARICRGRSIRIFGNLVRNSWPEGEKECQKQAGPRLCLVRA